MHCKIAQRQMALAVGEDLPLPEANELQTHLSECSTCRQVWEQHQRSFAALQDSRVEPQPSQRDSVWPTVATRIQQRQSAPRRSEFNGWIAGLAVMAACVLVFVFTQEESGPLVAQRGRGPAIDGTMIVVPKEPTQPLQYRSKWPDGPEARRSNPALPALPQRGESRHNPDE